MKRTEHHEIRKGDALYPYCVNQTQTSTNLRNAVRFRQRNLMTGLQKPENEQHELENEIIQEARGGITESDDNTLDRRVVVSFE